MFTSKVVRHIFIPAAALVAEKTKPTSGDCVCKPSELPIYTSEAQIDKKSQQVCSPQEPGAIEQTFGTVRRSIFSLIAELKTIEQIGEDYIQIGIENAGDLIEYLQEEENTTPKYGAVALGGLAGLILGLRGGIFRRTLYTSVGALGMAAICYPKEAAEYSEVGIVEGKRYATILYNFVQGVKKDDPPLELPTLPSIPGSLSEAWDAAKSIGKSTTSTVTDAESQCDGKVKKGEETDVVGSEINPLCVVSEAHDVATSKSCHCPVGACMGHHEEAPVIESQTTKDACAKDTENS